MLTKIWRANWFYDSTDDQTYSTITLQIIYKLKLKVNLLLKLLVSFSWLMVLVSLKFLNRTSLWREVLVCSLLQFWSLRGKKVLSIARMWCNYWISKAVAILWFPRLACYLGFRRSSHLEFWFSEGSQKSYTWSRWVAFTTRPVLVTPWEWRHSH